MHKQFAASNREVSMMLKVIFAAVCVIGLDLLAFQAKAEETCRAIVIYPKTVELASDKGLAGSIGCLAARLPERTADLQQGDIETLGQIMILASKIIGNGHAVPLEAAGPKKDHASLSTSGKVVAGNGAALQVQVADVIPKKSMGSTAEHPTNAQNAVLILSAAEALMETMVPSSAHRAACSAASDGKATILRVSKIIGNG